MVGRELKQVQARTPVTSSGPVLEIRGLQARSDRGAQALQGIDLTVNAGEILGVAGVGGNGQSELAECVLGLREPTAGSIIIGGADIAHDDPKRTRERGVAYVPEDRRVEGLVLAFTVADNFILGKQDHAPFSRRGVLNDAATRAQGDRPAKECE